MNQDNHLKTQQNAEVLPSFFCTIASSESHQLINKEELERIIKFDAMTKNRTELYRKQLPISMGIRLICRYLPIDDDEVTVVELFDVMYITNTASPLYYK